LPSWTFRPLILSRFFPARFASSESASRGEVRIIEEQSGSAKFRLYAFLAVLALGGVTFFFGLGRLALVGPDEPRYAEVAREMFASNDYISPRLAGCLWFEKPALLYWASAAAYHLFGVNEFAARFPSALAAMLTVIVIYLAIKRTVSMRLALAASIMLVTMGIFFVFARAVIPDMLFSATMAVALISGYLLVNTTGRARLLFCAMASAGVGLTLLAKGLAGVVLVAAILAVYFFLAGKLRALSWKEWLIGFVVFAVVAASWYLPVTLRHGQAFIDKFFIEHHFQRYVTNVHHHPQPIYFYIVVLIAGLMPWTFFLIPAVMRVRRLSPRAGTRDSIITLGWIWVAVPLIFFSFSEAKLPGYLLPIFPALAIIVGSEVEQVWAGARSRAVNLALWLTAMLVVAIGVAFVVYLRKNSIELSGRSILFYLAPIGSAVAGTAFLAFGRFRAFISATVIVVAVVVVGSVVMLFPRLGEQLSLKSLSLEVAKALRPGERIAFFIMKEFSPVFYTEGRVVCGVGSGTLFNALHPDLLVGQLEWQPSLVVFTTSNWLGGLEEDRRITVEPIATQRNAVAVRIKLREQGSVSSGRGSGVRGQ
jgi:4-amino-4-deoxy-L-arabinose transferase-like glycosyltransferase